MLSELLGKLSPENLRLDHDMMDHGSNSQGLGNCTKIRPPMCDAKRPSEEAKQNFDQSS